jgi:hypothetical protein
MSDDVMQWRGPIAPPPPEELADRYAISQLCRVYALGMDSRTYELSRSVFAPDAFADGTAGAAPIDDYLPKTYAGASSFAATQHNIINQYVTVNGDEATCWSYAVAYHWVKPGEDRENIVMGVQYRDQCRRYPGAWQIQSRKVARQWADSPPTRVGP